MNFLKILLILVASVFGLNALAITLFAPAYSGDAVEVFNEGAELQQYEELRIVGREVRGYVNMVSPDPVVFLNGKALVQTDLKADNNFDKFLFAHERAHIAQKELVAKASGGYPSFWNPIRSVVYYVNLMKLDAAYSEHVPAIKRDDVPATGLEAMGDCYARQATAQTYGAASYIQIRDSCIDALPDTILLMEGKWPTPEHRASVTPTSEQEAAAKGAEPFDARKFIKWLQEAGADVEHEIARQKQAITTQKRALKGKWSENDNHAALAPPRP